MKEQPYSSQFLNDLRDQPTGAQFSFLNSLRINEKTNKEYRENLDSTETTAPKELSKKQADKIFQNLNMLAPAQFPRKVKIVNLIEELKSIVRDENENSIVDGT